VLPAGVLRNLGVLVRGDWGGALRAAAIVAGLAITTIGYLGGRIFDRAPLVDTVPLARPGA
jgi:hypothetical protein